MKFLIKILCVTILVLNNTSLDARAAGAKRAKQAPQKKQTPAPKQVAQRRSAQSTQQKISSYADALAFIKTKMPSQQIIQNNSLTPAFIDFVKSLSLSDIETKALLQAGVNLHAIWTDNDETNKNILLSLRNSIQNLPSVAPIKPIPSQPNIPLIPNTPIKPAAPIRPIAKSSLISQTVPNANLLPTNTLCMFLDPFVQETLDTSTSLVYTGLSALYQQAAPIILTSNLFASILTVRQRIGDVLLQQLHQMIPQQAYQFAVNLRHQYGMPTVNPFLLMFLAAINFNKINYYYHKFENLVLLIPQEYIINNRPNLLNATLNEQAQACGFNPNILNAIAHPTLNQLREQLIIQQKTPTTYEKFIPNLTSMFSVQKKAGELISPDQDAPWLMYMVGHGSPAQSTMGDLRHAIKSTQENLQEIQQSRDNDPNAQQQISTLQLHLQYYEKITKGKSSWPDSQRIPESAQIAGMKADQFAQLIEYFNKNLNMGYLHYVTCFAGGSNQSFVNGTLSSLNVNFIISSQGMEEKITSGASMVNMNSNKPGIEIQNESFADFFRLLKIFFTQPEEYIKIKEKGQDPLVKILGAIIPENSKDNKPVVRFPGAGFFAATPLSKKTKILTQTMVKAHEIENKPIDVSNENLEELIIQTPRINVPLKLGNLGTTFLIIPSPKNITSSYESITVFKEINFGNNLPTLLLNLSLYNSKMYRQTFIIKKLTGIGYRQSDLLIKQNSSNGINNIIIQIEGVEGKNPTAPKSPAIASGILSSKDIQPNITGLIITTVFELKGTIYQSTFSIRDFTDLAALYRDIYNVSFDPLPSSIDMNYFAERFVKPQEVATIAKPITLESIADFIDSKIDKQDLSMAIWSEADMQNLRKFATEAVIKQTN